MKNRKSLRLVSIVSILILAALACNFGSGPAATEVVVAPTDVPVEPTTPPEPTETVSTDTPEPEVEPTATEAGEENIIIGGPDFEILMVNGFLDSFDSWNVVGLVRNNTERDIDSIEIEVELFDANEVSLYADTTYADLFNLAPGEISTFSMTIFEDLPDATDFVATVVGNSTTELERATLTIANTNMVQDDTGDTHITGEFVNDNAFPVFINSLAAATFNAAGEIQTANDYSVMIRYLDPGESGPFRVSITGSEEGLTDIQDFEIYVDAEVEEAVDHFSITLSDAYDYLDTFDGFHLVGEATNNSDVNLNIRLVAGIYAADGTVLDASSVDMPINALKPGETSPYDFDFWGPLSWLDGHYALADTYRIFVDAYWTWDTTTELIDLGTQNDTNEFDDFSGQLRGDVVNNSGGPIDVVTIVVVMRETATGRVVGTGYDYVFEEIPDGGTSEYSVFMDIPEGFDPSTVTFEIIVKGERP